jgi:tetratricopeptide (TPR) repeat protein
MSRSEGSSRRAALLLVAAALAAAQIAAAQGTPAPAAAVELTRSVQQSLKRLQEQWLQWTSAFLQDNPARAEEAIRQIAATARQVGFARLPDLSLGAAARAVQSAREGNLSRARWALDAAEALDPGRPEISFARATVARAAGRWTEVAAETLRGYRRLFVSSLAEIAAADLRLWFYTVLLVAAALFVVLQGASKGSALYRDLHSALSRRLPGLLAHATAIVVLCAPVALPGGLLWLLLYWSALLWGYQSASERIVSAAVWMIAGIVPLAAAAEQERIAFALSPPMKALDAFGEGRLYGGFFSDLQVLRTVLPGEPASLELMADVHRTLGQWEIARSGYREVVQLEPQNVAALINLGAYSFRKGEFAVANDYFIRAGLVQPPSAAAFYNLSLSYSESYLFEDSKQALARARELGAERVDAWIRTPNPDRVLTFNGSLARAGEIRAQLRGAWISEPETPGTIGGALRGNMPLAAAAAAAAAALALHLARRRRGYSHPASWLGTRSGAVARWARTLLPPFSYAEEGEGFAAFATLLALSALVLLPAISTIGVDLPIGRTPGRILLLVAGALGFAAFVALRVQRSLDGED